MNPVPDDLSLHVKRSSITLNGLTGADIDDCFNVSNEEFKKLTELTLPKFTSRPRVYDKSDFCVTKIETIDKGFYLLGLIFKASNMTYASQNCSFKNFRRYRALFFGFVVLGRI